MSLLRHYAARVKIFTISLDSGGGNYMMKPPAGLDPLW
jgi:hypothetical protein